MSKETMVEVIAGLSNEAEKIFPQLEVLAEHVAEVGNEELIEIVQEMASYFAWVRARAIELSFDG